MYFMCTYVNYRKHTFYKVLVNLPFIFSLVFGQILIYMCKTTVSIISSIQINIFIQQ